MSRAKKLACFTVLWAIHSRLMEGKRWLGRQPRDAHMAGEFTRVRRWLTRIEELVGEFSKRETWVGGRTDLIREGGVATTGHAGVTFQDAEGDHASRVLSSFLRG